MKLRKSVAKGLALGIIISNLPLYSFANETNLEENKYTQELSNIETKEDLQNSAQKALRTGDVDTWIEGLTNMPTIRGYLTSAVVDGKIYCIGGHDGSSPLNTVEVYDPITNSWETKTSMPTKRDGLTSSVIDEKIYCIGGFGTNGYLNKVEVYDPATDTWETKTNMPTNRTELTSAVVDGKIYCIGGRNIGALNKVEVYDPAIDTWETKNSMPTPRIGLVSEVVDGKIYCIGGMYNGQLSTVEVYDPATDSWGTKNSMPTPRYWLTSSAIDGKIYCIGGWNRDSNFLNTVEVYDPATDSWETKTSMSTIKSSLTSDVVNEKIYCIGGRVDNDYLNTVIAYIAKGPSLEDKANSFVSNAESTKDPVDIESARDLVNQLEESELKSNLQNRLNAIVPNLSLTPQSVTSNLDIYIKSENMLSLSLDTNSITFEDFSGVEDVRKENAVNLTVNSSLPYKINAYMVTKIQNSDGTNIMDKEILNIKANGEADYNTFVDTNTPIVLFDDQPADNNVSHGIDLMLKGNLSHEKDIYKTVIKFEAEQK